MVQIVLMAHVVFGVLAMLAAGWVFVDALQVSPASLARVRRAAGIAAGFMWVSFICGGLWYVAWYKGDRIIVLDGPWPWAHNLVMETKEHLVMLPLLLATYLPLVTANDLPANLGARRLVLTVSGLMAVLIFTIEGAGAIVALAVKTSLLAK